MKKQVLSLLVRREMRRKILGACVLSFTIPMVMAAEDASEIDTLIIQGTELSRYEFYEAESATGFLTDIGGVPRTIQVIPEQLILDQNAQNLNDVLSNSAAVTRSDGFGGVETEVNIRGIGNQYLFVDGSPVNPRYNLDVVNIESVEVVLGPASILHGQVSPGGLVNVVTKKPQIESAHSVQLELDEYGKQKLTLDSTGSLTDKLQYRVVLSGEDSETYRELTTDDGTFTQERTGLTIAPSLTYTPNDQNTFTLRLSHTKQELPIDRGTVAVNDGNDNFTIFGASENAFNSEFDARDSEDNLIQFDWDFELNNGWVNKAKIGYYEKDVDDYQTRAIAGISTGTVNSDVTSLLTGTATANGSVLSSNNLLLRRTDFNDFELKDIFLSDSLSGDYQFAGVDNTLYIGANFHSQKRNETDGLAFTEALGFTVVDVDVIDITDSVHAANSRLTGTDISNSDTTTNEFGLSLQNLFKITDDFNVLAGLRYDIYDIDGEATTYYTTSNSIVYTEVSDPESVDIDSSNDNVSTQLGALYDLSDQVSVYASYAESFTPNFPSVTEGVFSGDFDPETAKQFEVGVKSSLLNDKLRVSLSAYKLDQENVATVDDNLNTVLNGETEINGVDVSTTMQFFDGLNVLASYSYLDAEIVKASSASNDGNTPTNIPDHKARVWGSYEIRNGGLTGLGFGLGGEYVSKRFGNDANTFSLPSYTVYEASAWYYLPISNDTQLRLNVGVKNLTDETYYTASGSNAFRLSQGDPRTFYATARLEF